MLNTLLVVVGCIEMTYRIVMLTDSYNKDSVTDMVRHGVYLLFWTMIIGFNSIY